ncbi:MAG TPA: S41 family peptidase [Rhabdochlamydiaceae bacterium]|nr:S41 family peptidase [Rhabdochlamydiaceae bacterium]
MYRAFFLFFLVLLSYIEAKPPELNSRDTRVKIEEILKAHVSYQQLTPDLMKRIFDNYLDELDPIKTYFIEDEVLKWTSPSEELLKKALNELKKENFSTFLELHQAIVPAIERRVAIEKTLENTPPIKNPSPREFKDLKDLKWVKNGEELVQRIKWIKGLQFEVAEKFNEETKGQFVKKLEKRRLLREEELMGKSSKEREQLVLSYVLKALSSALDSQTAYFTPSEANQFMIQVQQKLFGIGAQLRDDLNGFTIVRLLEDSPASRGNKLKAGDRIIAVNNEPVVGMEITEAVELIRGPQGSNVILTILREMEENGQKKEEKLDIDIVRGEVILKESRLETFYEPFGDGVIGILHLFSFYQDSNSSSTDDLHNAILKLKNEHNLKGMILDLRNNAGGLLPQAVSVSSLFIKKGIVVSVKDNTGKVLHLRNTDGRVAWDGPLLIATNKTSASAAEIVAQTLQDYGRALVVGDETTYGKGTFQTFTLEASNYGKVNPKGEYKVTRGRYYTVSGKSPQLVGVKADIVVPGIYSELEIGEKFSKYPLENDQITANFDDDLSDVPSMHRKEILRLYKFNLQPILTLYQPYLEKLKKNSEERIKQNKNYQNLIKEITKKDQNSEPKESFGQTDLQLTETINVMKDLIFFSHEAKQEAEPVEATGTDG